MSGRKRKRKRKWKESGTKLGQRNKHPESHWVVADGRRAQISII